MAGWKRAAHHGGSGGRLWCSGWLSGGLEGPEHSERVRQLVYNQPTPINYTVGTRTPSLVASFSFYVGGDKERYSMYYSLSTRRVSAMLVEYCKVLIHTPHILSQCHKILSMECYPAFESFPTTRVHLSSILPARATNILIPSHVASLPNPPFAFPA